MAIFGGDIPRSIFISVYNEVSIDFIPSKIKLISCKLIFKNPTPEVGPNLLKTYLNHYMLPSLTIASKYFGGR